MTTFHVHVTNYLTVRRALGFKLERAGKQLAQFADYLDHQNTTTLATEHALAWAKLPTGGSPQWWAMRLSVVRSFAIWLHSIDPATEVPGRDLLPHTANRATPYLYTDEQIAALIAAARLLRTPLRVATYQTLVALLYITGMRVGEVIRLDHTDIDFRRELLVIRDSKFGKSREVPLHATTLQALRSYLHRDDRYKQAANDPAVFISPAGKRVLVGNVQSTFRQLVHAAQLTPRSTSCRPRMHDLRHSFAVRTISDCVQAGGDVQRTLTLLSTWLGHAHPRSTYWYLTAAPELMIHVGEQLDAHRQVSS